MVQGNGSVPRGRAAAIFDLDRTLLKNASGPLLNEALAEAGLVPGRSIPGMGLLYRFNDVLGETLPMMALARGVALGRGLLSDVRLGGVVRGLAIAAQEPHE